MRKQAKEKGRNSSLGIRRLTLVGIVVAVLALGTMAAVSLRTSQAKDTTATQNAGSTGANTSLRSTTQPMPFAPQTAQIRPLTQEEAQQLADGIKELVNQSTDGLQTVRHADGSVSLNLEGRFQSVVLAKKDENGKVVQSCVDNRQSAAAFFGIDPQLLGIKGSAASFKTASPAEKGELR